MVVKVGKMMVAETQLSKVGQKQLSEIYGHLISWSSKVAWRPTLKIVVGDGHWEIMFEHLCQQRLPETCSHYHLIDDHLKLVEDGCQKMITKGWLEAATEKTFARSWLSMVIEKQSTETWSKNFQRLLPKYDWKKNWSMVAIKNVFVCN